MNHADSVLSLRDTAFIDVELRCCAIRTGTEVATGHIHILAPQSGVSISMLTIIETHLWLLEGVVNLDLASMCRL